MGKMFELEFIGLDVRSGYGKKIFWELALNLVHGHYSFCPMKAEH